MIGLTFLPMTRWRALLVPFFAMLLLSACQTAPTTKSNAPVSDISHSQYNPDIYINSAHSGYPKKRHNSLDPQEHVLNELYQQFSKWHGTPYRFGGNSRSGIDCSAFVQLTYLNKFGIELPRTASQQARQGERIDKSDLQPGDLVFFRNGNHVGIYLEGDKFLHASSRKGVTISSLNNVYWSRNYWRSVSLRGNNNQL